MNNITKLLFATLLMMGTTMFAQSKISGTVIDSETGESLPGATVFVKGTKDGGSTNFDGNFEISTSQKSGELVVSYVGFQTSTVAFNVTGNSTNLGKISLVPNSDELEEIVLVGKGVIDLAKDRKTPIAVSTIKAAEIQAKAGSWDLPEVIKSTPSVQNIQGGGFGDGQMYLRGFDQTNTAFLLNGQPINGMEDGLMYWSNWSGVMDIANGIQIQRGLGSSKLAISSVGGTVNIVTKTLDSKEGGFFQQMLANNDYTKTTGYFSTGLINDKFAFSGMLGHWQGDGYMDGTKGQGQTYFLSFGYKANEKNTLNLLVTGAPQWHGASSATAISTLLDKGLYYSNNYGYSNGKYYAGGRNYYHKPIVNLNWDYEISEKASLSTVAYGSLGRGGFAFTSGIGRTADGLYDFDNATNGYTKSSVNAHNWYGLVSNLNYKINETMSFNVGADARMYNGKHYRQLTDFFGASSVNISASTNQQSGPYTVTETFGYNPWDALFGSEPARNQKVDRDYEEWINYAGVFGQFEYAKENFSGYLQAAVNAQSHQRQGYFKATEVGKSEKVTNPGYNVKVGGSYAITEDHKVFANAGYYSRQPYHDDIYVNSQNSNQLNIFNDVNQKITGLEAGYQFKSEYISANLNVYHTIWDDRLLFDSDDTNNDQVADVFNQSSPAKQVHQGVELELFAYPTEKLKVQGYVSVGDWKYDGNVTDSSYDDAGNLLSTGDTNYIDGVKIGNVAQTTAGLSFTYEILKNFKFDSNFNYFGNIYGNTGYSDVEFDNDNNRGGIKMPNYSTIDSGLSYKWLLGKEKQNNLQFRFNLNNVLDKEYIQFTSDNKFAEDGTDTWEGVNTANRVRFGYGRTWNFSIRYNF